MPGYDPGLLMGTPTLTQSPSISSGTGPLTLGLAGGVQPHHSTILIVLLAVGALVALDKAGFRFAVTAGRS